MNETERRILLSLITGHRRIPEIIKAAKISKATFHRVVEDMVKNGLVSKDVAVNQGYPPPVYYSITEKGKEALKKALKVDEFLEKFEREEIDTTHLLVLNHITNLLFYGRREPKREELEYEAIAILSGWMELKNDHFTPTKGGWRAVLKFLPTRQFQDLQMILEGIKHIEIDGELREYLATLVAASMTVAEEVRVHVSDEEFEEMVRKRFERLKKEIERKVRRG